MGACLGVCICTHNPRRDIFEKVLRAIADQTASKALYRVLIVDNCSSPPIASEECRILSEAGVVFRIVQETKCGLSCARIRAISETQEDWLLFVDDDNELDADFIARGLEVIQTNKEIGCFGGKLLLPDYLHPKLWVHPFLPYLGIKDCGNDAITVKSQHWGVWEPPGAGAFVHRSLLDIYRKRASEQATTFKLGRTGKKSLASCDDSLLMRGAFALGLACSYQPQIVLQHHIDPNRFKFVYLIRLLFAYGKSHVILDNLLDTAFIPPVYYSRLSNFIMLLAAVLIKNLKVSVRYAVCMATYHVGAFLEWKASLKKEGRT
jgi:Glycosyltransferases involved in cell wall biogenesis